MQQTHIGIKDGKYIHIKDIPMSEKGLACGCVCPICGGKLVANKGEKNTHHFKHHAKNCGATNETILHKRAKELLAKTGRIILPEIEPEDHHYDDFKHNLTTTGAGRLTMNLDKGDFISLEDQDILKEYGFKPDVVFFQQGNPLCIEIAVSHFIDEDKLKKIVDADMNVLEVNLSGIPFDIKDDELIEVINQNCNWVHLSGLHLFFVKKHISKAYLSSRETLKIKIWESVRDFVKLTIKEAKEKGYKPIKSSSNKGHHCRKKVVELYNQSKKDLGYIKKLVVEDGWNGKLADGVRIDLGEKGYGPYVNRLPLKEQSFVDAVSTASKCHAFECSRCKFCNDVYELKLGDGFLSMCGYDNKITNGLTPMQKNKLNSFDKYALAKFNPNMERSKYFLKF